MKRLLLSALAFALFLAIPTVSHGQSWFYAPEDETESSLDSVPPQRIGVPPTSMELTQNGTGTVTGYCFDEFLIAPRRVSRFENILAGNTDAVVRTADGKTMSLADAVAKGTVDVKALQLQVYMTNKSGGPLTVELRRPVVLWDRPGGDVNPLALRVLETGPNDYDLRQKKIWQITTAERDLALLGYYDNSIWHYDAAKLRNATTTFQKLAGIAQSGQLDDLTMSAISGSNRALQKRLRSVGFTEQYSSSPSPKPDLAGQIRNYQRAIGAPTTGRWSGELAGRLGTHERIVPQVQAIHPRGGATTGASRSVQTGSDVLAWIEKGRDMMVLVQTPEGVELWKRRGSRVVLDDRGADAFYAIDNVAANRALEKNADERTIIYSHVTGSDGRALVEIGDRSVDLDAGSLAAFVNGGAIPPALEREIDQLIAKKGGDPSGMTGARRTPNLVVYRGPFVGEKVEKPMRQLDMSRISSDDLARAIGRAYGDKVSLSLIDDLES